MGSPDKRGKLSNGLQDEDNASIAVFRRLYFDHDAATFTLICGYFGYRANGESARIAFRHVMGDITSLDQREKFIDGLKQGSTVESAGDA